MNNLKISVRLALLIGFMSTLLLVIGGIGFYGVTKGNQALNTVYSQRTVPITLLSEIQYLQLRNQLALNQAQLEATDKQTAVATKIIEANSAQINKLWEKYQAIPKSAEEEQLARAYWDNQTQYTQQAIQPALGQLQANELFSANQLMGEKVRPMFEVMREKSNALMGVLVQGTKEEYEISSQRNSVIRTVSVVALVAGLVTAVLFGWSLLKGITAPLGRAVSIAHAVANGNLNQHIPTDGTDEISALLRALAAMQEGLVSVVSSVRKGSDGVATACSEIAQGNHDLSSRTEHQASALEETAASMEELSSTVRQNADSAREANRLAMQASQVATDRKSTRLNSSHRR